jgi:multidrug efflux pump subunit AcrB
MISDVFIARPRLAFVVSIVLVLAGLIALAQIPVAQYPDIVPPQVTVTTSFPGASAVTVASSVAEPIEAQVNGVDKAIYMASTCGNDGSYSLTVSFAVGSDPNTRRRQCPEPGQPRGLAAAAGGHSAGADDSSALFRDSPGHRILLARQ